MIKVQTESLDAHHPDLRPNTMKKFDLNQIVKARELLLKEMHDSPTIEELAKRVGINQQKLKAGFKKIYGQTIYRYLRNARLERARYLILEDKGSIREIAQMVGYSNQSHFARRFKEKFGVLPKELAKATRP